MSSLQQLATLLQSHFNQDELKAFCFDLNVAYEDIVGEGGTRQIATLSLIEYCQRRDRIPKLLELCVEKRPTAAWPPLHIFVKEGVVEPVAPERVPIVCEKEKIVGKPRKLFGREGLIAEVHAALDRGQNVLLYGLAGSGKTAVAATIAGERLQAGKGPVLWLQPGSEQIDSIYEAIVRQLDASNNAQFLYSRTGNARLAAMRDILQQTEARLLVVDDSWQPEAMQELQQALSGISDQLPMLITSRQKIVGEVMLEVTDLSLEASLETLAFYAADETIKRAKGSAALCRLLGNHPYALEIAGTSMRVGNRRPEVLRRQIANAPHRPDLSARYAKESHHRVEQLLDASFNKLPPEAQELFCGMGAFFAPGMSADLLAAHLGWDVCEVADILDSVLLPYSLVKRRPGSQPINGEGGIDYYYMHALTFSYARARFVAAGGDYGQTAARIADYVEANSGAFDLLYCDQNNIVGGGRYAQGEAAELLLKIVSCLAVGGYPEPYGVSYLDARGHTEPLLKLFELVEQLADQNEVLLPAELRHYLLSKLGTIYLNQGQWAKSIETYAQAAALAPTPYRRVLLMAVQGRACLDSGQPDAAAAALQTAYDLAVAEGDDAARSFVLEHRSFQAGRCGDYAAARRFAAETVEIYRQHNDEMRLGYALLNLGSAQYDSGDIDAAFQTHNEARVIAQKRNDIVLLGSVLYTLAENYHSQNQPARAKKCAHKALQLMKQTGDAANARRIEQFIAENNYQ